MSIEKVFCERLILTFSFKFINSLKILFIFNIIDQIRKILKSCISLQISILYIYIYIYIYIFQTFFVMALLLIVNTWNSSPLRSNFLQQQCTCTNPTTSGKPHGSPLVWAAQWSSSQPLSSPQLSHNDSLWAQVITKSHREQRLDYRDAHLGQIVWDNDGVVDWCIVLVEMPLTRFEECWPLPTESLAELP